MDHWKEARSLMTDALLAKLLGVDAVGGFAQGTMSTPPDLGTRLHGLLTLVADLKDVSPRFTVETRIDAASVPVHWRLGRDAAGHARVSEVPRAS